MDNESNPLKDEFLNQFSCNPPENLPESLTDTYQFMESLAEHDDRCVFLIKHRESGEKCILKITSAISADDAAREFELLSKLDHPAIPRAIHFMKDAEDRAILVRSYAEGTTLDTLVERDGAFSARQTMEITNRLCQVLHYLHKQTPPVIYKDIKPQNVILTPNGKITLIDFGISREYDHEKTTDTRIIGSFQYASPEHLGFKTTDMRSDVFSVGRLMSYLSTGDTFVLPKDAQLTKIIQRCTNLEPGKRYASMDRLSHALHRALNPPTRKEMMLTFAVMTAILLAGIILYSQLIRKPAPIIPEQPLYANAQNNEQDILTPVSISVLKDGRPFADCSVSADNHHWFVPDVSGKATLSVVPYGGHTIFAAVENRQVSVPAGDLTDGTLKKFTLELKNAPVSPELIELKGKFGEPQAFPLALQQVDEVTLAGNPIEIAAEIRNGEWHLVVSDTIQAPGHYAIFLTGANEYGKVDSMIHLHLEVEQPLIMVSTAEEMNNIRNNLDGNYALSNDVDLSIFPNWEPIDSAEYPFTGTFDGRGHHIHGLKIRDSLRGGLFGETKLLPSAT